MSNVTNAILLFGIEGNFMDRADPTEANRVREINRFFETDEGGHQKGFVNADDPALPDKWYGGAKCLECTVLLGAFNYLYLERLCKHLLTIAWECPEEVQLLVKEQEDDLWHFVDIAALAKEAEDE